MDALSGFIVGTLITWPFLLLIVILAIFAEHNESRGWAVFFTIVTALVSVFYFQVTWIMAVAYLVGYAVVGLIWSFYRYKRHAQTVIAENKDGSPREKEDAIRRLHPKQMLGTITAWIMVWPFSLAENLVGDLLSMVQTLVTKVFRSVYYKIYDSAVSSLK